MVAISTRKTNGRIDQGDIFAPNHASIKQSLELICEEGETYEVRVVDSEAGVLSGYFDDRELMADWVLGLTLGDSQKIEYKFGSKKISPVPTVYITINPVSDDFLSVIGNRVRAVKFEARVKGQESSSENANDKDILYRTRLLIDADPIRKKNVSSTDEEHELALDRVHQVRAYLTERGFPDPCLADSGNGGHLVYGIDLPNDDESTKLIKGFLAAIAAKFSDDKVDIDLTVFNAARLCTTYGTMKRKGDSTAKRPHRVSKILDAPASLEAVPRELLEGVAQIATQPVREPSKGTTDVPSVKKELESGINLERMVAERDFMDGVREETWLKKFNGNLRTLDVVALFESRDLVTQEKTDTKFEVQCPWWEEHTTGNDEAGAVVFKEEGKFPSFRCLHAHCVDRNLESLCDWFGKEAVDAHCSDSYKNVDKKVSTDFEEPDTGFENTAPKKKEMDPEERRQVIIENCLDWKGFVDLADSISVSYAAEPWIPMGQQGLLYGPPKAGKTTLCADLATSMLTETKWIGCVPTRQMNILIFDYENPVPYLRHKLVESMEAKGGNWDDVNHLFHYFDPRKIRTLCSPLKYDDIMYLIEHYQKVSGMEEGIVLVDTARPAFNAMFEGDSNWENTATQVRSALEIIGNVTRASNWASLVIHHANKSGGSMGSMDWLGTSDYIIDYKRDTENLSSISFMGRPIGDPPEDIKYRLIDGQLVGKDATERKREKEVQVVNQMTTMVNQARYRMPIGKENAIITDAVDNLIMETLELRRDKAREVRKEMVAKKLCRTATGDKKSTLHWIEKGDFGSSRDA